MNAKFKFLAVAALALTVGFTSCSKSEGETLPEGQKKVTISIDFGTGSGRAADNQTANGQTPDLKDLKLFFVGNNVIQKVETVTTDISDMTTGKSFTVPNATTKVYAIGNTGSTGVNSPTAFPAAGASEDDVKSLMIDVTAQTSFKIFNLSSGQGAGGTAASGVSFVNDAATFDIMPAVARYEIKKVSAGTTTTEVDQPLSGFKLTGIFITNTYNKLGLDYATLPSATADIIKVGPGSASFETYIPARLQDVMAPASNATSFIPTEGAGYFWHYFLAAPIAGKGTTLDGVLPSIVVPLPALRTARKSCQQ